MSDDIKWQYDLEEYIKQGEPGRIEKSEAWQTAIGLQAVDGLKTSEYLLDTAKCVHSTTKFLELFFGNLLLDTNYELKNRFMHIDYADDYNSQSVNSKVPKSQFDTLDCTLDELAILELIKKNPSVKQQELSDATGKSLSTVKRLMKSLQDKNYIRRESGKRYGKWEVLV